MYAPAVRTSAASPPRLPHMRAWVRCTVTTFSVEAVDDFYRNEGIGTHGLGDFSSNTTPLRQSARRGAMSAGAVATPGGWCKSSPLVVLSTLCAILVMFATLLGVNAPPDSGVIVEKTPMLSNSIPPARPPASSLTPDVSPPSHSVAKHEPVLLTKHELGLLRSLDPGLFASLPPDAGSWEDAHSPCFRDEKSSKRKCLPNYHVIGAWQSGGQAFNAKLCKHPDVLTGVALHFWNEPKPVTQYLDSVTEQIRLGAEADEDDENAENGKSSKTKLIGDASPGVLANTWTESQRLHLGFKEYVAACWKGCQNQSDVFVNEEVQSSRRKCIDGELIDGEYKDGCMAKASKLDPLLNWDTTKSAHVLLSVPHLLRAAYGNQSVKIVAVLRNPLARLKAAFRKYPHYAKEFGDGADGFAKFIKTFIDEFETCMGGDKQGEDGDGTYELNRDTDQMIQTEEPLKRTRQLCAYHFESLGPRQEGVFYHCDQLIKTMYGTFLKTWVEAFGKKNVLALRAEDVFSGDSATRKKTLRKTVEFLGLREPSDAELHTMDSVTGGEDYATAVTDDDEEVDQKTKRLVNDFFRPETETVSDLFGNDEEGMSWMRWGTSV